MRAEVPTSEPYLGYLINYQIAKTLSELQVYDQAEEAALQAREKALLGQDKTEAMRMQLLACEILLDSEQLKEAHTCFDTALYHSRRDGANEGVCRSLIGLGNVYYYQELDSDALRLYDQAFNEAQNGGDNGLMVSALLNIGAALSVTADRIRPLRFIEAYWIPCAVIHSAHATGRISSVTWPVCIVISAKTEQQSCSLIPR